VLDPLLAPPGADAFVLAAATADLAVEPAARPHADAVEFRMDLAADAGADPLADLDGYDGSLPVLATDRTAAEGGAATDESARLDRLRRAARHDAVGAVDLELATLRTDRGAAVAASAREAGARVVASVHEFESTPPVGAMRETLAAAAGRDDADVAKLAVTATDAGDALALLRATHAATAAGHRVATMAMGEAGRHTRAVAPVYGSRIGYAPVDPDRATAPGQYDLATLRGLVDDLRPEPGS
jgi:3-dehydroquinate dehydratase-1